MREDLPGAVASAIAALAGQRRRQWRIALAGLIVWTLLETAAGAACALACGASTWPAAAAGCLLALACTRFHARVCMGEFIDALFE